MICPQCGYDIGSNHKCLRCGYEVKTLVTVDEKDDKERREQNADEPETKVIDPSDTFISNGDDYGDGFEDPFDMLFGDIFDPIGDLLGGLFGLNVHSSFGHSSSRLEEPEDDDDGRKKDHDVVEVKKVEVYDENGNPVKQDGPVKKTVNKVKQKVNEFKNRNNKNRK